MRTVTLFALMAAPTLMLCLSASTAIAQPELVQTPLGPTRVEGERFTDGGLRLYVGDRELIQTEEDAYLWAEAIEGDLLLVGLGSGGTACPEMWQWVNIRTGETSERFGTCLAAAEVSATDKGEITVSMPSWDFDFPTWDYVYDGTTVTEVKRGQEPAELPPSTPADAWIGHYGSEMFKASDWREPLIRLMGEDAYSEAQAAFTTSNAMEVEGDWVVGTGCVVHACDIIEGVVAMHRTDGRVLVALSYEGQAGFMAWVWGDQNDTLPPTVIELLAENSF
jgi:hypothetical protein